jgi:hypothetical protein
MGATSTLSHGTPHGVFIDLMARCAALYFGR